jgi:peroxin-19
LFQYPAWLEENQTKLEPSEFERFSKQKTVMDQVCAELLKESDSDSQEVKKRRFDMVVGLLQKVRL